MNNPFPLSNRLARALTTPTGGALRLADELLAASHEQDIRVGWQAGRCQVSIPSSEPPEQIEVPVQKSVIRALLARVAALCNERVPNSVSPYRGTGEVAIDPKRVIRVKFVNTPDEQSLELSPAWREAGQPTEVQSLAAVVEKSGPLPPRDVVRLLKQIAEGLAHLHGGPPVVHRDIRPENILIHPSNHPGRFVVVDFGIAGLAANDRRGDVAPPTEGSGPDEPSADTEDDYVYQMGSLAYYALTKQPISDRSPPLDRIRPDIPSGLKAIIDRSLGVNAGVRFSGVSDMLEAIERLAHA